MVRENPAGAERPSTEHVFAYPEVVAPGTLGLGAGIVCALIALFTLLGPLGTDHTLSEIERAAFWGLASALVIAIGYAGCMLTFYLARTRPRAQVRLWLTAMSVIVAGPCTAITYTVYGLFHDGNSPDIGIGSMYLYSLGFALFLVALADHVVQLRLKLKMLATDARALGAQNSTAGMEEAPGAGRGAESQQNSFFDHLPEEIGHDVLFLKASGHYIEVTTSAGSATILMRLSDAAGALGDLGLRIHRSYWVAHRHVNHLVQRDQRTLLHVTGDHELPVSRSYLSEVRAAIPHAFDPVRKKDALAISS